MKFTFLNTKHKLGMQIWGDRDSFHELYELVSECWECADDVMTRAGECSYIGVFSYFCYTVRHTFMGDRLVKLDGKPVMGWSDGMLDLFEEEQDRFEVGMEFSWPQMLFIMASWWECLKDGAYQCAVSSKIKVWESSSYLSCRFDGVFCVRHLGL